MVAVVVEAEWLLISQVAAEAGVAENTCRRYARLFPEYFETRSVGRRTTYRPDSVELVQRIVELYSQGRGTEEVRELLGESCFNRTIDVTQEDDMPSGGGLVVTSGLVAVMLSQMANALDRVADQQEEIRTLREDVERLREEMRGREDARIRKALPWWRFWGDK